MAPIIHIARSVRRPTMERIFLSKGNYREETAQVRNAEWLPRENALVDMRW